MKKPAEVLILVKDDNFPVAPHDHFQDLRSEMVLNLEPCGNPSADAGRAAADLERNLEERVCAVRRAYDALIPA